VQLAAPRWAVREQAFKKLNIGCNHDWRGPILHGQPQLVGAFARAEMLLINCRMMFKYDIVAQDIAEDCAV